MGKTITEKILAKAAGGGEVSPGDYIEVGSRCPTPMGNAGSLRGGVEFCAEWKVGVFDPQAHKNHRRSSRRHRFAQCCGVTHAREKMGESGGHPRREYLFSGEIRH
jgi:hypothetical protein